MAFARIIILIYVYMYMFNTDMNGLHIIRIDIKPVYNLLKQALCNKPILPVFKGINREAVCSGH